VKKAKQFETAKLIRRMGQAKEGKAGRPQGARRGAPTTPPQPGWVPGGRLGGAWGMSGGPHVSPYVSPLRRGTLPCPTAFQGGVARQMGLVPPAVA
jgi:hypothetical protein